MPAFERTRALYDDLARALGAEAFTPDDNGGIELTVGEDITLVLFAQDDNEVLAVVPLAPLPPDADFALANWLLRSNLYDSDLEPFRVATDADANVLLWGRVPLEGMNGERMAGLIDAVAAAARELRAELVRE